MKVNKTVFQKSFSIIGFSRKNHFCTHRSPNLSPLPSHNDHKSALDDDDAFHGTAASTSPSPPRRSPPPPPPMPQSYKRPPPLVKSSVKKKANHRKTKPPLEKLPYEQSKEESKVAAQKDLVN